MEDKPAVSFSAKPSPARLSRTPSWIMLGFVIGALFVWLLPSKKEEAKQPVAAAAPAPLPAQTQVKPRKLSEIEAVFAEWGQYAVWDQNRTEVAMWNSETQSYSDSYEVLREGELLFFRSIPALTRPLLAHGTKSESPLVYTETEEMRRKWLENRSQLVPARAEKK